jgi:hypothetical protein
MKRHLVALAVLSCLGAPAIADTCAAAAEAATRAALDAAETAGRRTATVRVTCDGERQSFVLHRSQTAAGTAVTVREVKRAKSGQVTSVEDRRDFGAATAARVIRVGE